VKRFLDVLLSFCLILLALPVFVFCAIVIKLESNGPVLFRQPRMGRNFHPFAILKFRTMQHRSKGSPVTLGQDARITRCGRWMRRHKLDELPQLWNVLRGDMSLVGPRPVVPSIVREFRSQYERLLCVRPGLTDPAALKYYNECELLAATPNPLRHFKQVVTPDKLRLSAEYLERATVWSDLAVLAQTAFAVMANSRIEHERWSVANLLRVSPMRLDEYVKVNTTARD
jgi:lipopolysaccharide/colanic/teichoic acid biosynthesis glycosyltransferase